MTLPKFEDWKAPWEVSLKEGDEPTFDFVKGKQYLYNVLADKERLQGQVTERDTKITDLESKIAEKAREGETETQRLTRERDEAVKAAEKAKADAGKDSVETLKMRVAIKKGLNEFQMKRLQGSTIEELEADADEVLANFKGSKTDDDGGEGDEERSTLRSAPGTRLRNPATRESGAGEFDPDKAADDYLAGTGFSL